MRAGMNEAARIIATLGLERHPEGGWFRETFRAVSSEGGRSPGTAILFLLEAGERSHWHRVDADELWAWHAGSPLDLMRAETGDADPVTIGLGGDVLDGYAAQALIPAGQWQAAEARSGWVLVSCFVSPGFEFSRFELAPPDWYPGRR